MEQNRPEFIHQGITPYADRYGGYLPPVEWFGWRNPPHRDVPMVVDTIARSGHRRVWVIDIPRWCDGVPEQIAAYDDGPYRMDYELVLPYGKTWPGPNVFRVVKDPLGAGLFLHYPQRELELRLLTLR